MTLEALETEINRLLQMCDLQEPGVNIDLAICRAYNRHASSVTCVPVTHPGIARLQPVHKEAKYNLHLWHAYVEDTPVIVRASHPPEALFTLEAIRVRFGYYPQNPNRRGIRMWAARLNVFLLEPRPWDRPSSGDVFLVWLRAVEQELIQHIRADDVTPGPWEPQGRIAALRVAAHRHHELCSPVEEAVRLRKLPEDLESAPAGVRLLAELPHVALWEAL